MNYFDQELIIDLDEKFDFWRAAPRWVRNINLMMVKLGDYSKLDKDNIVNYRDNWIFEFHGGKLGEAGFMKLVRQALFKFNGMKEIKESLSATIQEIYPENSEKLEELITPAMVTTIWKRFRTAAGLRELQNFAKSMEHVESSLSLRLDDKDDITMSNVHTLSKFLDSFGGDLDSESSKSHMLLAWELNRMKIYNSVYMYENYR